MQYLPLPKDIINTIIIPYLDDYKTHYNWVIWEMNIKQYHSCMWNNPAKIMKVPFYSKSRGYPKWSTSSYDKLLRAIRLAEKDRRNLTVKQRLSYNGF